MLGTIAACCSTLAFLPQLTKVKRQGGADVSGAMLALYIAGLCLWLGYGVLNHAGSIIGANLASLVLVSAVAIAKVRSGRGAPTGARRLRIAIDMDEVMADALGEHLRRYNRAFAGTLTPADLHGRHLEDCIPAEHRDATEAMLDSTFFAELAVMADCQDVVRELMVNHDVFIVTAAMDVPCSFDAKYRWLRQHFPFVPTSNFVFCGDKHIIDADYLIDDRPRHFARFKGTPLLFSAPHNAGETGYHRVSSWTEVRDVLARLAPASLAHNQTPGTGKTLLARAEAGL
jgi:5'(3')-deoxyribonucleotidase/uncharacterized protein with PQ loop repeat